MQIMSRPPADKIPDRAQWAREKGKVPVNLSSHDAKGLQPELRAQAARLHRLDWTTLDEGAARAAQNELEGVCEQALFNSTLDRPDDYLCFYDAGDESFWAYPL